MTPHPLASTHASTPAPGARGMVVAMAASLDRLKDLSAFFRNVDARSQATYVLMVDATQDQMLRCLLTLQQATGLPVQWLPEALALREGHLYLVTSGQGVRVASGWVQADPRPTDPAFVSRVDDALTQLAHAYRDALVAVSFLDGLRLVSPGWQGVRRQGGIVLAAADAGTCSTADASLPASQLPARIRILSGQGSRRSSAQRLAGEPGTRGRSPHSLPESEADTRAWDDVLTLLNRQTRHDFGRYGRERLIDLLDRRMRVACVVDLAGYRDYLQGRPSEAEALLAELAVGGPSLLSTLRPAGLLDRATCAGLLELATQRQDGALRAWNVDCARGEDAYAIAIQLLEAARTEGSSLSTQVFATDADPAALADARTGVLPAGRLAGLHKAVVDRYFTAYAGNARASRSLRGAIVFASHDLLRDPPISKVHLVAWRNRISQLAHAVQREMLQVMHFSLVPGGYLLLGDDESSDALDECFVTVDARQGLYRARLMEGRMPAVASPADVVDRPLPSSRASTEIMRRSLERDSLPCLIVSKNLDVVHLCDRVGRFLIFTGGEPSRHVLSIVDPGLNTVLRQALQDAIRTRAPVYSPRVPFRYDGRDSHVGVAVKPFVDTETNGDMLLVLFDEADRATPLQVSTESPVRRIETHLEAVRSSLLDGTAAAPGATWHEADEALKVINEELRSATEELRVRESALNATIEGLTLRISELERSIAAADATNDHLHNLSDATDQAVLFTDRTLTVRFHNRACRQLLGATRRYDARPLAEVLETLDCPRLAAEAYAVMHTLQRWDHVAADRTGRRLAIRMTPYVNQGGDVTGVAVMLSPG